ncbi:immobilization antigen (macronuclear) [Tetrahymena thermophila SB210]|uniref:Immobilization antigen n=1 Tax=Tetrahymena thermophila (strain SB210) TaxID=312017 RepID=Q22PF2_TETTS|nr:immobilization antigen [Tetrahymena thermophila SB210]EAR87157.1 immobilization antigen [Tetrahymena thermophila SB210]|eukprot:XP_001007402.1 immobilization antigen [Tetrahymena thermophila SB210]
MKSMFFLFIILDFIQYINAQCTKNAIQVDTNCYCNKQFYGNGANGGFCFPCPLGSTSLDPSNTNTNKDISYCSQCQKNYYMISPSSSSLLSPLQSATCNLCPNGSGTQDINAILGIQQCNVCQINFYMISQSTANYAAQCGPCPTGSGNDRIQNTVSGPQVCTLCLANYYMTAQSNPTSSAQCQACPSGSGTENASTAIGKASTCLICQKNFYMKTSSSSDKAAECIACPIGTGTQDIQKSISDQSICNICQMDYYMTVAASGSTAAKCTRCPVGSQNPSKPPITTPQNASSCSQCLRNYYMTKAADTSNAAQCTICPGGSGTNDFSNQVGDASQCDTCLSNYYMQTPPSASNSAQCVQCPAFSFKVSSQLIGSQSQCFCYDQNALPLNTINKCVCKNGYQGLVTSFLGGPSGCKQCSSGQFSLYGSLCQTCPPGSVITPDLGGCICNDQSKGTAPWDRSTNSCFCQDNYYGDPSKANVGDTNSCNPCPDGTVSKAGKAKKASDCVVQISTSINNSKKLLFFAKFLFFLVILI